MRSIRIIKLVTIILMLMSNSQVHAYSAGDAEETCKKPQVREFSLPTYQEPEKIEVAPESTFSFKLSVWTSPDSVKLTIKDQPIDFKVESNSSFHKVEAVIPAQFTGKFARINLYSKAVLGCHEQEGWLIKVADK